MEFQAFESDTGEVSNLCVTPTYLQIPHIYVCMYTEYKHVTLNENQKSSKKLPLMKCYHLNIYILY